MAEAASALPGGGKFGVLAPPKLVSRYTRGLVNPDNLIINPCVLFFGSP